MIDKRKLIQKWQLYFDYQVLVLGTYQPMVFSMHNIAATNRDNALKSQAKMPCHLPISNDLLLMVSTLSKNMVHRLEDDSPPTKRMKPATAQSHLTRKPPTPAFLARVCRSFPNCAAFSSLSFSPESKTYSSGSGRREMALRENLVLLQRCQWESHSNLPFIQGLGTAFLALLELLRRAMSNNHGPVLSVLFEKSLQRLGENIHFTSTQ